MLKGIKRRWQGYWDNTAAMELTGVEPEAAPAPEPRDYTKLPPRQPTSNAGRPDPVAELTPQRLAVTGRVLMKPIPLQQVPRPKPAWMLRREGYERDLPQEVRDMLREMDHAVAKGFHKFTRFVDVLHGRPILPEEWETPQYLRRHQRNMNEVMGDLTDLTDESGVKAVAQRVMERARRASGEAITGMIPVVTDELRPVEEAWA